jgi:galactokinase
VELLGNHTDYNRGLVLGAAIDRGLSVCGEGRADNRILLNSKSINRAAAFLLGDLQPQIHDSWSNYMLGVVSELLARGLPINGFSAEIDGNLPAGHGLSSSAALEVASALFLLKLFRLELPRMEIARLCQRAEQSFTGVQSGLLDQVTSLFGEADHAVFFDADTDEVSTVPFPPGLALVVSESGSPRQLAKSYYNERRAQTRAAADFLGLRALRDISFEDLQKRLDLNPILRRRALHVVGETERVRKAIEFLRRGDGAAFGALMYESHESSRTNFENSTPELDLLVKLARELRGVLGARLTGAGFGGATITLCDRTYAEEVATSLADAYERITSFRPITFVCRIAAGAV